MTDINYLLASKEDFSFCAIAQKVKLQKQCLSLAQEWKEKRNITEEEWKAFHLRNAYPPSPVKLGKVESFSWFIPEFFELQSIPWKHNLLCCILGWVEFREKVICARGYDDQGDLAQVWIPKALYKQFQKVFKTKEFQAIRL